MGGPVRQLVRGLFPMSKNTAPMPSVQLASHCCSKCSCRRSCWISPVSSPAATLVLPSLLFHVIHPESLPLSVLAVCSTALIQLVPDALSIHTLKARSPPNTSLSDHFFAKFTRGTSACLAAQRNFTESLAAYSIVNYILQVCLHSRALAEAVILPAVLTPSVPSTL